MNSIHDHQPQLLNQTDIGNVFARFQELGIDPNIEICLLPNNFMAATQSNDLFFPPCAPDIKVLFRKAGVTLNTIEPNGVKIPFRDDRDATLLLPALFLSASYIINYPDLTNIALGVLANYVTDCFKGIIGTNRVKCSIYVETTDKKTTKKIDYDGPPEQFGKIISAINKAVK